MIETNLLGFIKSQITPSISLNNISIDNIKQNDNPDIRITPSSTQDVELLINLFNFYNIDNLLLDFSIIDFTNLDISYSVDNINWNILSNDLSPISSISLTFDTIVAKYIKLSFKAVSDILLSSITSNIELDISENLYKDESKECKQKEVVDFLPEKMYKGSDIKNLFKEYLKL
jgi:hypothetical protein